MDLMVSTNSCTNKYNLRHVLCVANSTIFFIIKVTLIRTQNNVERELLLIIVVDTILIKCTIVCLTM